MKNRKLTHPFLFTDEINIFDSRKFPVIGLRPVVTNRHHLYPKNREHFEGINKNKFLLRIWEYKHFYGWNRLFQFCYVDKKGYKKSYELVIDEIITLMIINHPFITSQVGSPAWKILFGNKKLHEARDILCRMLYLKFKRQWRHTFCYRVNFVLKKVA